jgi:hypothetical protein
MRKLAILTFFLLGGCAGWDWKGRPGDLDCNAACTPEMAEANDSLQVDRIVYNDVFGKEWVAGVSVDGQTTTEHNGGRRK